MPDTYLVIAGVALAVYLLGFFIDPGVFSLAPGPGGESEVIDAQSYRRVSQEGLSPLFSTGDRPGLFNAVYEGLVSGSRGGGAVGIIAFILITGGAFGVVMATGAVARAVQRLAGATADPRLLLATLFLVFSLSGAVFGMGEEVIPFVLMLLPLFRRLGYDGVTTLLVTYGATQIGFATSWMNPFSVAIAQGVAGLPLLSGMPLRIGMWCAFTALALVFTLRHAAAIRQPAAAGSPETRPRAALGAGDWAVLAALLAVVIWVVWGVVFAGYYLPEIATQFLVLGVAAGIIGCLFRLDGMHGNGAMQAFRQGAADLLPAALVVGFARGIVYLMGGDDPTRPSLLNTLLHVGSGALGDLPGWLAAWLMYLGQSLFNFLVTSGSGQAALTMPVLAPLSDLLGVTRQVAVLAFQLGDGLTNLIVPTSAALMGCLGAARVEWLPWLRAIRRLLLLLFLLASAFVVAAALGGYR
jgi:uncharacterized ion transporter superfamily protein YfcC